MLGFKTISAAVVIACIFFTGCLEFFQQPTQPSPAAAPVIGAATPSPTPALVVITPTPTLAAQGKQVEEKQVEVELKEIEPSDCLIPTDKQELSEVTPVQGGVRVRQGFLTGDPCWNVAARAVLKENAEGNVVSLFINASRDPGVICIQCIAIKTIEANLRLAPGSYLLKVVLERGAEKKILKESNVVVS